MTFVDADGNTRRKVWTLMGHSMGEGLAGQSPLVAANPHFGQSGTNNTAASASDLGRKSRRFPGLKMFVSRNPWPSPWPWQTPLGLFVSPFYNDYLENGSPWGATPVTTDIGTGAWLDMTLDRASSPRDAKHAYYSPDAPGYMIPSGRSIPLPPDEYRTDGEAFGGFLSEAGGGAVTGIELPLSYSLSAHWGEEPYGVKLAIPSSYLLRKEDGFEGYANYYSKRGATSFGNDTTYYWYGWLSPLERFDWDPTSGRLYQSMLDKMTGAAAALPDGEKLDVRLSIMWMGDNDAGIDGATPRIVNFKKVYQSLIDKWRQACVDNDWTTLPKEQIPICIMGIYGTYGPSPIQNQMNEWMQEMEDEDPYIRFLPTTGYESLQEAGYSDASHMSHNGYVAATEDIIAALADMEVKPRDAMDSEELVTVGEVRSRVRTFYENNKSRTGATDDDTILTHLNGAMFHIVNKLGDLCYWLRRREQVNINVRVNQTYTFEKKFQRIVRIEKENDPEDYLRFRQVGYVDGGKLQITLLDRGPINTYVHYIEIPKELAREDEVVPIPRVALEWLVTETARRIARSTQNVQLQLSLNAEAETLHVDVRRHCATLSRTRNDRLHVQRSLRGRVNTHFGRHYWWQRR